MSRISSNSAPKIISPAHILLLFLLLLGSFAQASITSLLSGNEAEPDFLPVEEAFQVSGELDNDQITIRFAVTPGHYLYRHMFGFEAANPSSTQLGEPSFPQGVTKYDKFLKRELEIFPSDIEVAIPIITEDEFPEIRVKFQGCAEAGLCYPPTTQTIIPISQSATAQTASSDTPQVDQGEFLTSLLDNQSLFKTLILFFLGGLALTFTPCVLPMIPIVSTMVAGSKGSRSHTIMMISCYVLAMSVTYALAGMLMGYFGASLNLQARLQSPWLLVPFAILFVALALSMFGLYELQLPAKLRDKLSQADQKATGERQGTWLGAALMGVFSTLLVSPCVSAPLAGALVFISSTEDVVIGGLALFSLGIGMGTPLFLIGLGGAALLPKAGMWMDGIKAIFGVLMLGVAIWLVERVIPGNITLLLWGALAVGCAVYMGALHFAKPQRWQAFRQALGILLLIYGISLFVGGIQGQTDPLRPLSFRSGQDQSIYKSSANEFVTITTSAELTEKLAQARQLGQPVVVDFYADWCISCKIFDREVLPDPQVVEALRNFTTLRLDLTENSADQRAILSKFNLFGPPAFLFYSKSGQELKSLRKQGEIDEKTFISLLKNAANS
ncbi:protein-disulfide reductase DsbD [Sansalvadorimonas sp. 2012CJ34-2]|uniref:Thiol:disulfide interchange protein DsbD n=1 Tax=Parendozoicomonas callyspongiae TaxID=2942213 RepID=A0ABT0PH45_9GAMM|nr:protein-disulfide reductase DsbD [Sansalvadorimonas sp. 2012CJ34-2]MCL6270571.1 protein-disulfide reductase DsbD [Sansalvadorimonas sp. 2012CJ34-2]